MERTARCTYEHVFDAADETGADESPSVWRCPHPASGGSDRCLFHRPAEETRSGAVTEALREAVEDDARPSAFVGAAFERIDLAGVTPPSDASLDFRGAMVKSDIDLRDATLDGALRLDRVSVGGAVCMQRLDASGAVSCRHLQIGDRWVLCEARFDERFDATAFSAETVVATAARFEAGATFRKGVVDDDVSVAEARFGGPAWFSHTRLGGRLDFGNAAFDRRLSLAHCRVRGSVVAASATVDDGLSLEHLTVEGELDAARLTVDGGIDATTAAFGGRVDCTGLTARDGAVDFTHCAFGGPVYFDNASVEGRGLRFRSARFESGPASFVRVAVDGGLELSDAVCSAESPVRLVEAAVGESVICDHARFGDELFCSGVRVARDVDLSDCTVGSLTFGVEIGGRLDFAHAHVTDAAAFGDTVVHGPARFTSARFDADPTLAEATLDDTVAAYDVTVERAGGR
ncbi:pentapeptide repeat-containing protein [Haloferax sp. KTX1]|uniref:pentapeptide repeat-containing protein n=1 Tax=Haloferax sp. KTX1 TaxID=2600597 RepID=UPI0011DDB7A2|nr:pentapeptide repeat-containing protein [Haloferax sp. KTX1]